MITANMATTLGVTNGSCGNIPVVDNLLARQIVLGAGRSTKIG